MRVFDPADFLAGKFAIICYSEAEAEKCVKMLYAHGFHWWEGTELTVNNTQFERTDGVFIIYYSEKTRPNEYDFFWTDLIEDELVEAFFYDFSEFIQPIEFDENALIKLLEMGG